MGKKVEREHLLTYRIIKRDMDKNKKLMDKETFFKSIVADHLTEDEEYYTKLKKAGL